MVRTLWKRRYFETFSPEQHSALVTVDALAELQKKFYLTHKEMAYLFGIKLRRWKKIASGEVEMPFLVQLALYYLMQDPAMVYKIIKEKERIDKQWAMDKEKEMLERGAGRS